MAGMTGKELMLKLSLALTATALHLFGPIDKVITALAIFMVLDFLTGILAALYVRKNLSSKCGFLGICRKVAMLALVAVGYQLDILLSLGVLRLMVAYFLIANEGLSIVENAAEMNVGVPDFIKEALENLKHKDPNGTTTGG